MREIYDTHRVNNGDWLVPNVKKREVWNEFCNTRNRTCLHKLLCYSNYNCIYCYSSNTLMGSIPLKPIKFKIIKGLLLFEYLYLWLVNLWSFTPVIRYKENIFYVYVWRKRLLQEPFFYLYRVSDDGLTGKTTPRYINLPHHSGFTRCHLY